MEDILAKIRSYQRVYAITARGHYLTAARKAAWHRWLGVPSVVITAITGTTVFATIEQNPGKDTMWPILVGTVLLAAAVLSSLQTFFRFSEEAERSTVAGRRNNDIRRRLEHLEMRFAESSPDARAMALEALDAMLPIFTKVAEESPTIPDKLYEQAVREYEKDVSAVPNQSLSC